MNAFIKYIILLIVWFQADLVVAQVSFTDETQRISKPEYYSSLTKAAVDVNGDGLLDIIRSFPVSLDGNVSSQLGLLEIAYQQEDGSFTCQDIGQPSQEAQISITVGDIDGDGDNDIITGGWNDGLQVYKQSENGFDISTIQEPLVAMQGSLFGDFNTDGNLDFFACHDEGLSQIWLNDTEGNLIDVNNIIDFQTEIPSDNSGNYGAQWTDFDDDGDLDLYIAKCSAFAEEADDPRRINVLYENQGDNTFVESAESWGLKDGSQSWTPTFFDMDNDGDLDCYITNHYAPSLLFENINNESFVNVTQQAGVGEAGNPLQCVAVDFDNDMYLDLLVTGSECKLFHNQGDGTFVDIWVPQEEKNIRSFASGDFNNDGFIDVYSSYYAFEAPDEIIYDKLYFNVPSNQHFLSIDLTGVVSNKSAVGAKVKLFVDDQILVREVQGGQSYGITCSYTQHFGLADNTGIDSLKIYWPSGIVNSFYDVEVDTRLSIIEDISSHTQTTQDSRVAIFPNPTMDILFIKDIEPDDEIILRDGNGKCISKSMARDTIEKLSLRNLNASNYYIQVLRKGISIYSESLIKM